MRLEEGVVLFSLAQLLAFPLKFSSIKVVERDASPSKVENKFTLPPGHISVEDAVAVTFGPDKRGKLNCVSLEHPSEDFKVM